MFIGFSGKCLSELRGLAGVGSSSREKARKMGGVPLPNIDNTRSVSATLAAVCGLLGALATGEFPPVAPHVRS